MDYIELKGVRVNNLKNITVRIPKGVLTCVTSVAGCGKSSLIHGCFVPQHPEAIVIDQHLAEAFFNRGIARLKSNRTQEGIADLSKAGELGLYKAYSVIKQKKP